MKGVTNPSMHNDPKFLLLRARIDAMTGIRVTGSLDRKISTLETNMRATVITSEPRDPEMWTLLLTQKS